MTSRLEITAKIIEMNKDFDPEWIKEMIVSRILLSDFKVMITDLEPHISANDPNGAKFAIETLKKLGVEYGVI